MVIHTESAVALYCAVCGNLHVEHYSRFMPLEIAWRRVQCSCGESIAEVRHLGADRFAMKIPCVLCARPHVFILDKALHYATEIPLEELYCNVYHVELGVYGHWRAVETFIKKQREQWAHYMVEESGEGIVNPEITLTMYNRIHDMAMNGHISCTCGRPRIVVQILSDSIVIACETCGSVSRLPAQNEQDLLKLNGSPISLTTTAMIPRQTTTTQ